MTDKIFGLDFTDEPTPTGASTISVNNGANLVDVQLLNLHKALTTATDTQSGTIELATLAEILGGTDAVRAITPAGLASVINNLPQGTLWNGKLSVTVTSNNITVALKTLAGNNPSATDPVYVRIQDTVRSITSSLSVTKNAGTNWFNSGSSVLATQEIDYFVYLGYNATNGVTIGFARIPHATRYGDFSATTTNEQYCAISTITNAVSTDYYELVGRFAATLSATASFNWSVPTFTALNLINRPIRETRWLSYTATLSAGVGSLTSYTMNSAIYHIVGNSITIETDATITNNGTGSTYLFETLPLTPVGMSFAIGSETVVVGSIIQGALSGSQMNMVTYNNLYPGGTNYRIKMRMESHLS